MSARASSSSSSSSREGNGGGGAWEDCFSALRDREDLPPMSLPRVTTPKRVVLVRHGQSTWNACGRMQGSSDYSRLTEKGRSQAETTALLLQSEHFDAVYSSPLSRATETATIVWGSRRKKDEPPPLQLVPGLREIDLYSFQGLLKDEARRDFPAQYRMWKSSAENFDIDGHVPVRELWRRASRVWHELLMRDHGEDGVDRSRDDLSSGGMEDNRREHDAPENILVVAHNAVNQALIGTALGLKPSHFRRLVQSNAAATVLSVIPTENGEPRTVLDGLNETPEMPLHAAAGARVVLVCDGSSTSFTSSISSTEASGGESDDAVEVSKAAATAEMLRECGATHVMSSPVARAKLSAGVIAETIGISASGIEVVPFLRDPLGLQQEQEGLDGEKTATIPHTDDIDTVTLTTATTTGGDEPMSSVWKRAGQAWAAALSRIGESGTVVMVGHPTVASAMLCRCLSLPPEFVSRIRLDDGSVSIVSFPDGALGGPGIVNTANYTKHLDPQWAVPVASPSEELLSTPLEGF